MARKNVCVQGHRPLQIRTDGFRLANNNNNNKMCGGHNTSMLWACTHTNINPLWVVSQRQWFIQTPEMDRPKKKKKTKRKNTLKLVLLTHFNDITTWRVIVCEFIDTLDFDHLNIIGERSCLLRFIFFSFINFAYVYFFTKSAMTITSSDAICSFVESKIYN